MERTRHCTLHSPNVPLLMHPYLTTTVKAIGVLLLAIVLLPGCGGETAPATADTPVKDKLAELKAHFDEFSEHLAEDHQFLRNNTLHNIPFDLSMTDDRQYRQILSRLEASGLSPETSPQLFKYLEAHRATDEKGTPAVPDHWAKRENGESTGGVNDINLLRTLYTPDDVTINSSALSSVYGGCDNTTVQFQYYTEEDPTVFHTSQAYQAYGAETEYFVPTDVATLPSGQAGQTVVCEATITPSNGSGPFVSRSSVSTNATSQCVTAPNYGTGQGADTPCPAVGSDCINNMPDLSTPISACFSRNDGNAGVCGNCNYGYSTGSYPDSLSLQIAGQITFPSAILANGDGKPTGTVTLYLEQEDGGCIMLSDYTSAALPSSFSIIGTNELSYCFSSASFVNSCFPNLNRQTAKLNMSVWIDLVGGASGTATLSSSACQGIGQAWCANVPSVCVVQGCLDIGTQITMADGSEKPVEEFMGGESVLSTNGEMRTVGATSTGHESIPMYRIKTENGKEVLMSSKHPVPTDGGMMLARDLQVGATVTTLDGMSKIASVTQEMSDRSVHNFVVGDDGDAAEGIANMYANGIMVGDLSSQYHWGEQARKTNYTLEELKAQVDPAWHIDLENSFKKR